MLRYIEIKNIALIDRASIDFGPGLCVLTGETGAGKSIIIDSINAVLGARAARDIVRKGTDGAAVSAVFSFDAGELSGGVQPGSGTDGIYAKLRAVLNDNGIAGYDDNDSFNGVSIDDGIGDGDRADAERAFELILSREINNSGRSICRINGKLVAAPVLKEIGELIVDLHGQHENHSLLKRDKHIDMIDNFGGAGLLAKREKYTALHSDYWRIKRRIADLKKSESERARAIDILTFQINEIKSVRPQPREDERLLVQIEALANAEKIKNAIVAACQLLNGDAGGQGDSASALENINGAIRSLSQITQYSNEYMDLSGRLSEARFTIEDAANTLRAKMGADELDPGRLDKLSARHEAIERLKRKYGGSIKDVHNFYKQSTDKLAELTDSEQTAGELENSLRAAAAAMTAFAADLTAARQKTAAIIEAGVVKELLELEMKSCRFKVLFSHADNIDEYNAKGRDQLEFLFCANPGEELKPLTRIASGGEMSRVMLAIKSVLANADDIPTMIFDEIDNGISGNAAARVAEKMHLLSKGRQIVCVTHLAQIACMADDQYLIEKTSTEYETQTNVNKLTSDMRADEISRMLGGGAPTEASLRLSNELLDRAARFKDINVNS